MLRFALIVVPIVDCACVHAGANSSVPIVRDAPDRVNLHTQHRTLQDLTEMNPAEEDALRAFASRNEGSSCLSSWRVGLDPCTWQGVQCYGTPHVVTLGFNADGDSALSRCGIRTVPVEVGQLSSVQDIDLSYNDVDNLPPSMGALSSLQYLDITSNRLASFPEGVCGLSALTELDMGENRLNSLPECIGRLRQLESLVVSGNYISTLPAAIGNLTQLRTLDLKRNRLKTLPESLGDLKQLTALYLSSNRLEQLPSALFSLSALEELDLSHNLLREIPDGLNYLTNVWYLAVDDNMLSAMPSLGGLSSLEQLSLSGNADLITLPDDVCKNMEALWQLNAEEIGLRELPDSLIGCDSLEELYLDGNELERLPSDIGNLTHLSVLRLNGNKLPGLPNSIGDLINLGQLEAKDNALVVLPTTIGNLTALTTLAVAGNSITSIPEEIQGCSSLVTLRADHNKITDLPEHLSLPVLEDLYLQHNNLESIPSSFGSNFPELLTVDLSSNRLVTLPTSIGLLTKMSKLRVQGNALRSLPDSLTQCKALKLLDAPDNFISVLPQFLASGPITHLYAQNNPIDTSAAATAELLNDAENLVAFGVSFSSTKLYIAPDLDGFNSCNDFDSDNLALCVPHLEEPQSPCHVNAPCSFRIQFFDRGGVPDRIGGLQNLTVRAAENSSLAIPLVDGRDGFYTGTIPPDFSWIDRVGQYRFRLFYGDSEFFAPLNSNNEYSPGCTSDQRVESGETGCLLTLRYSSRVCPPLSHTEPDPLGSTCVCKAGFIPDNPRNGADLSCHKQCEHSTKTSSDGEHCVCAGNTYNSSVTGIIICRTGDWVPPQNLQLFQTSAAKQTAGNVCLECPEECATCEHGLASLLDGWRPNANDTTRLKTVLTHAVGGALFAYRCPGASYGESVCPSLTLNESEIISNLSSCRAHHSGVLCASCESQHSLQKNNSCIPCNDYDNIRTHFGVSVTWFVVIVAVGMMSILAMFRSQQVLLNRIKAELKVNAKIVLGLAQVLVLLKDVLDLMFPPPAQHAHSYAAIFAADVHSLVQFDCRGWDWFDVWRLTVVYIPSVSLGIIGVRYVFQRHKYRNDDINASHSNPKSNALGAVFAVVFMLYPRVSSAILSTFRCRDLGEISVLEGDYHVSCTESRYSTYRAFASLLLVLWPVGIPLGLLTLLYRQWQQTLREFEADDEAVETVTEYHKTRAHTLYGFCVDDFRPGCWWFEPLDMLRKLALSGLLQFVARGTAAQVLLGCCLAVTSFGFHIWLLPYQEPQANVLKVAAEAVLFLTFLISFVLRVLPRINSYEPLQSEHYGWVLVAVYVAFVALAVGVTFRQVQRRHAFRRQLSAFFTSTVEEEGNTDGNAVTTCGTINPSTFSGESASETGQMAAESVADVARPDARPTGRMDAFYRWVASQ